MPEAIDKLAVETKAATGTKTGPFEDVVQILGPCGHFSAPR